MTSFELPIIKDTDDLGQVQLSASMMAEITVIFQPGSGDALLLSMTK